jgi:hypothetical protein
VCRGKVFSLLRLKHIGGGAEQKILLLHKYGASYNLMERENFESGA